MIDDSENIAYLSFDQQRETARQADGWLQGRYYSDAGTSVKEFLTFEKVFDLCPFEVGANYRTERRAFRARFSKLCQLLELNELLPRAFQTLSNGEMRRVLFARALLKAPKTLILENPMGGLDASRRECFRKIIGALRREGIDLRISGDTEEGKTWKQPRKLPPLNTLPIVELKNLVIRFGRRTLFNGFSWTLRQGERWILKGRNGSGKSTLMALINGDSPLAYANEVTVFGHRRGAGTALAEVRRRIGMVSPEMQTYLNQDAETLLASALAQDPELLLLDEPFFNLDSAGTKRVHKHLATWLKARPKVTAICVAHRPEHVPVGFNRQLDLDELDSVRGRGK